MRTQAETDGVAVFRAFWLFDKLVEESIIASYQAAEALELIITQGARLPQQECTKRIAAWKSHKK